MTSRTIGAAGNCAEPLVEQREELGLAAARGADTARPSHSTPSAMSTPVAVPITSHVKSRHDASPAPLQS